MIELTEKQRCALEAIKSFISVNSFPPTSSELTLILGYSSNNSVVGLLSAIERKGYIKRTSRIARSIVVLEK
jgi:repressor LexA